MKFTAALLALAACAQAATGAPAMTFTTKKVNGAFENEVKIASTPGDAHDAAGDTFKITLPPGVHIKDGDQTHSTDYTLTCKVGASADQAVDNTKYTVSYAAKDKLITIKNVAATYCAAAGALTLNLKKAAVLVAAVDETKLKIANSKVTAEATTPVAGASTEVYATDSGTAGTLSGLKIPSVMKTTGEFSIKFTPKVAAATSQFLTVYLPGYKVASPKCKVGTKDAATVAGSTVAGFGYIQVTGAADLWATAEIALTCASGVTAPDAAQAADTLAVVLGATDQANAVSTLALPAVTTPAPTRSPTRAPTRAFSAAPRSATGVAGFISAVVAYFLF